MFIEKYKHRVGSVCGKRQRFTLTELLVVMAIMAILMGMALTPFQNILSSSGVDGAQRMLTSQLRMARQYAISKRERVALLLPGPNNNLPDPMRFVAFRSCIVDKSNNFQRWIQNTEWNYVPTGSSIIEVASSEPSGEYTSGGGVSGGKSVVDVSYDWNNDASTSPKTVNRAIIFEPTGRLSHSTAYVSVCEALYKNGSWTIRNGNNWIAVKINQFTGRVEVKRPGEA